MTLSEVIKRLRYKAGNIKTKLEPSYFLECADYLEKYRWHDLRKNPEDLPEDSGTYLCIVEFDPVDLFHLKGYALYNFNSYFDPKEWYLLGSNLHGDQKIIAWREIEPFEEVQE